MNDPRAYITRFAQLDPAGADLDGEARTAVALDADLAVTVARKPRN